MRLARLSPDERVQRLVSVWDGASRSDRRYLSVGSLAAACGVEAAELFGAVVAAGYAGGYDVSTLLRACYRYQEVVRATARGALRESGSRERARIISRIGLL
jgi:hypothetical protein